jgi:tRNA-dihydrouridine synthase A
MMAWTDRHCRYFHRLLAPHALLYTEMVTANALVHGDVAHHLDFDAREAPVVLQLGGSDPLHLAHAARLGERWGYAEINLNCGCPSERVVEGAFGACLMQDPERVADCVLAMREAVTIPVTIKHRIGIDRIEDYAFVQRFVSVTASAGCETFIVHARNAWLSGLSPKENREIPPLRHDVVRRLKLDFPHLKIVLNGGLGDVAGIVASLAGVDGVMIGRAAYQQPFLLARLEAALYGGALPSREQIALRMAEYLRDYLKRDAHAQVRHVVRHMLGLFHGEPSARAWRRVLSDARILSAANDAIIGQALDAMATRGADQSILPGFISPSGSSAALI